MQHKTYKTHINKYEHGCLFPVSALDNKNVHKVKALSYAIFSKCCIYSTEFIVFNQDVYLVCLEIQGILSKPLRLFFDLVIGQDSSLIMLKNRIIR